MINYDGKRFRPINTQGRSETTPETIFQYSQTNDLLTGTYSGGDIEYGSLIATIDTEGQTMEKYAFMKHGNGPRLKSHQTFQKEHLFWKSFKS